MPLSNGSVITAGQMFRPYGRFSLDALYACSITVVRLPTCASPVTCTVSRER